MTTAPRFVYDHTAVQRNCALYYVDCLDPDTGYTTIRRNAYVGETGRQVFVRFMEHLYDQPFGDIIVGMPRVDARVFADKAAVLEAEREAVERLRPSYNYEWNMGNPDRIEIWKARQHRDERDRARGLEPRDWSAKGQQRPRTTPAQHRTSVVVAGPSWWLRVARHQVSWWALGWFVLTVVLASAITDVDPALTFRQVAGWSTVLAAGIVATVYVQTSKRRRRRRR